MARGTQHRKRRPTANAAVASNAKVKARKPKQQDTWEDQLFFPRLRRHAKWVFVFLALVFAFSFVLFGVGSGSTGYQRRAQQLLPAHDEHRLVGGLAPEARPTKHPNDAKAWLDLATAQEQKNDFDGAIVVAHALHDAEAQGLGSSVRARRPLPPAGGSVRAAVRHGAVEGLGARSRATRSSRRRPPRSPRRSRIRSTAAVSTSTSTDTTDAYSKYTDTQSKAVGVYKKLVTLNPKDATNQYRLAQVAQAANNSADAIAAYTAFLKLAPNDSLAPAAKKALKDLKKQTAPTASASAAG